jgi:hypothetical protein
MKITVNLDLDLLAEVIEAAVREQASLSQLIEQGLRLRLDSGRSGLSQSGSARLAIYQGRGGLAANVDPLSNRSLFAAAEA